MRRKSGAKVIGLAVAGAATAVLIARQVTKPNEATFEHPGESVTNPPLNTLKPVADNIWVVDSGPIRPGGVELPIRMTVVRLSSGELLLHSPTEVTEGLVEELQRLGSVSHLVAPNIAHWTFVERWQARYPGAMTWVAPGLRDRTQVRNSGLRLDRDLSEDAPSEWKSEIEQGLIRAAGFSEVHFFHRPSRTLILTDLVQHIPSSGHSLLTRVFVAVAGTRTATTPRHLRALLRLRQEETARTFGHILRLDPERVIFAHGTWFDHDGAPRLRTALSWLKG